MNPRRTITLLQINDTHGRMSDAPSYAPPVEIGEVMVGGTIAQVELSRLEGFKKGEWVLSSNGWQDHALSNGEGVTSLGSDAMNVLMMRTSHDKLVTGQNPASSEAAAKELLKLL